MEVDGKTQHYRDIYKQYLELHAKWPNAVLGVGRGLRLLHTVRPMRPTTMCCSPASASTLRCRRAVVVFLGQRVRADDCMAGADEVGPARARWRAPCKVCCEVCVARSVRRNSRIPRIDWCGGLSYVGGWESCCGRIHRIRVIVHGDPQVFREIVKRWNSNVLQRDTPSFA